MSIEIPRISVAESLIKAQLFNEQLLKKPGQALDIVASIIQSSTSPLMLSHAGLVLTPRTWPLEMKITLAKIANGARSGLQQIAYYLATSQDDVAHGIRKNMLDGPHFDLFVKSLKQEADAGISALPFEVGRADIINGGALEVNAACLDAPVDFHDLGRLHSELVHQLKIGQTEFGLDSVPERSIVELIVETMIAQYQRTKPQHNGKPLFVWLGSAAEVFGTRDRKGYWPRELRFKQVAMDYLKSIGVEADFQVIAVEQLCDKKLVDRIDSAYRNLLPEDMNPQEREAIIGLCELAQSGRLVGSLTAELLTNKAAMAVITSPDLAGKAGIAKKDWEFFVQVFPPTAFLSSKTIYWEGQIISIKELLNQGRDRLFFKLSNGEEGRAVWSGSEVDDSHLSKLLYLAQVDPYAVLVQKKLAHFPFEAAVVNLEKYELDLMSGETDAGTHYQMLDGKLVNPGGNIVMTRFSPTDGPSVTSNAGKDGIFRPVASYTSHK